MTEVLQLSHGNTTGHWVSLLLCFNTGFYKLSSSYLQNCITSYNLPAYFHEQTSIRAVSKGTEWCLYFNGYIIMELMHLLQFHQHFNFLWASWLPAQLILYKNSLSEANSVKWACDLDANTEIPLAFIPFQFKVCFSTSSLRKGWEEELKKWACDTLITHQLFE